MTSVKVTTGSTFQSQDTVKYLTKRNVVDKELALQNNTETTSERFHAKY